MKKIILYIYILFVIFFTVAPLHLLFSGYFEADSWSHPFLLRFPPDKLVHLFMYLMLSILLLINFPVSKKVYVKSLLFGLIMECIQIAIPYRTFEIVDLLANQVGVTIPYFLGFLKKQVA